MKKAYILIGALVCSFAVESFAHSQDATATPTPFTSPQSIGDLIPASINLQIDGQWDPAGVAQASAAVSVARNQPATFQLQVESVNPSGSGHGGGYYLQTPDGKIDIHGTMISYHLGVFTTPDQSAAAARLQPGATVTVSGTIDRSDLNIRSLGRVILNLNLKDCKIVGATPQQVSIPPLTPSSPNSSAFGTPSAPTPSRPAPPTAKLTEDQARAVVLITGDNGEGTGFLIKTPDGPCVVTNLHVIGNNPNYKITTNTGALVTVLSAKAASDRDLVMLSIKDSSYNYLEVASDISQIVQPGDEVITPGNSEGGGVMLNTVGKVLGIGPERIEFDNPIYHGNSGGPVFQTKSGKVLGVVTEAMKVDTTDELDKASFANRASAIGNSMRYFGLRLDTVSAWVPLDFRRFETEAIFLDQFDQRTRALDSYINAPDDSKPEDNLWRKDDKIVKANNNYIEQASGADASQRMDAIRVLYSEFGDVANLDLATIQTSGNFYGFDQQRARDEAAYRKALKAELDTIGSNLSRLGSLPRTSN